MDDRFDQLLVSYAFDDGSGLSYVPGSYTAYGNDGLHLNQAINDGTNYAVGDTIADALHEASDHIPVYLDIQVPARIDAPTSLALGEAIVGGVKALPLGVENPAVAPADELSYSLAVPSGFSGPTGPFELEAGESADAHDRARHGDGRRQAGDPRRHLERRGQHDLERESHWDRASARAPVARRIRGRPLGHAGLRLSHARGVLRAGASRLQRRLRQPSGPARGPRRHDRGRQRAVQLRGRVRARGDRRRAGRVRARVRRRRRRGGQPLHGAACSSRRATTRRRRARRRSTRCASRSRRSSRAGRPCRATASRRSRSAGARRTRSRAAPRSRSHSRATRT